MAKKKKKDEDEKNYIYMECSVLGRILSGDEFVFTVKRIRGVEKFTGSQLEDMVNILKEREQEYEE